MNKSSFQVGVRGLGKFLFILYFVPATLATPVQLAQAAKLAQEASVDCNLERKQPTESVINALVMKARDYTSNLNNQNKDKALETLIEAFKLMPTLKDVQARANLVENIIVTPDGDTTLLEKLAALYVEPGQKEQLSPLLSQALPVTQSLNTGYSFIKTSALTAFARHYATIGQPQKALSILPQSLQSAKSLKGAQFKTIALTEIAETYTVAGKLEPVPAILEEALQFAKAYDPPNPYSKGYAIRPIAIAYAKIGQYEQAIQIAQSIVNAPYPKTSALGAIASQYAQKGQMEQALQLAQSLEAGESKAKAFSDIAIAYAKAGQQDKAFEVFSQAVELAQSVGETLLADIIAHYAEAGQPAAALQVAQRLENAEGKAKALAAIAFLYMTSGQQVQASRLLSQALESAKAIPESFKQQWLLEEMIRNYVKAERFDYAFQVAQTVQEDSYEFNRKQILVKLATQAAQAGQYEQALQIVQALDKNYGDWRNIALQQIALAYASSGQYDKAIEIAQILDNSGSTYTYRARTLAAIANQLLKTGQTNRATELYSQAVQVANSLGFSSSKAEAVAAVALELAISGQQNKASELLSQALQLAQTEKDASSLSSTLRSIADEYIRAQQYEFALKIVQVMPQTDETTQRLQEIVSKVREIPPLPPGTGIRESTSCRVSH